MAAPRSWLAVRWGERMARMMRASATYQSAAPTNRAVRLPITVRTTGAGGRSTAREASAVIPSASIRTRTAALPNDSDV